MRRVDKDLITITEETTIGEHVLEVGDKIKVVNENYGKDNDIAIMVTEDIEQYERGMEATYTLYTGASIPTITIMFNSGSVSFDFKTDIEEAIRSVFKQYRNK